MDETASRERRSLTELAVLVPVFFAPLSWWLAFRATRVAASGPEELRAPRASGARRLFALATVDTLIGAVVVVAKLRARGAAVPDVTLELDPTSPFEPLGASDCGDLWREQLWMVLWPVVVGCLVIGALWLRGRFLEPARRARWGLVLVPLALSPLVGIGAAHVACRALGGWSVGVGLLGAVAQGLAMLVLGGALLWFARDELRVVVGPRATGARSTAVAALTLVSGLARVSLFVFALWSLAPDLHGLRDAGIEAVLAGEHGLSGRLLVLLAAVLVAPAAEEVVFRGVLLPGLAQSMRASTALLVSSAVFALFHVPSHGIAALLPGLLGFAFGWARLRSGGLAAPIALHVANNLLVTLLTWFSG